MRKIQVLSKVLQRFMESGIIFLYYIWIGSSYSIYMAYMTLTLMNIFI